MIEPRGELLYDLAKLHHRNLIQEAQSVRAHRRPRGKPARRSWWTRTKQLLSFLSL